MDSTSVYQSSIIHVLQFRERFSKPSWFYFTPDSAKLSEADVDEFVQCLLPAVRMAVFSKVGTQDAAAAMHNLALVRPEMVLPDLLNRYVCTVALSLQTSDD